MNRARPSSPALLRKGEGRSSTRLADALATLIFFGLIALLLLAPIPYGSVEPWAQAAFECSIFALGFLWCIHAALTGSWVSGDVRLFLPLVATAAFAVLQSLAWSRTNIAGVTVNQALSADPYESWIFALRLLAFTLAGLLAVRFTTDSRKLAVLTNTIILAATLSAVFGIVRLTTQHHDGFVLSSLRTADGFAQFINKNHFAFLAEPAIGLLVAMILLPRGAAQRKLFYFSALILLWAALVLSRSRGGLLAASVQIIAGALFFVYARNPSSHDATSSRRTGAIGISVAAIVLVVLTVAGTTLWLGGDQLSTGVETAASEISAKGDDHNEGARRRDIWRATFQMARAHPIAGAGLGAYWAEIPLYHDASGVLTPQQAHSEYLELFASGGLIGIGLLSWFIAALLGRTRRALERFSGTQRVLAVGAIIGIVGVAVHSLVDFGLHMPANAFVFVMLLAMLSLNRIDQPRAAQAHRSGAFR
jgi:O-antigen ligase